jgi:branched-chain amino acid transport system ATP-binding protein
VRTAERKGRRRVDLLLAELGLTEHADAFASELSTGTKRLVELACVMASEPRVLLLDEPSSGLAQREVELLGPVVQRLARSSGCGVLVVEHDVPLVAAMADRVCALELGRVVASGPTAEVLADPRVVGSYLSAAPEVLERSGAALQRAMKQLAGSNLTG